jgi:uncharacterized protein
MKQLDPKAFWLMFVQTFLLLVFIFVAFGGPIFGPLIGTYISTQNSLAILLLLLIFIIAVSWIYASFSYKYYKYELKDEGFRKEYGVIIKKYVTIPYDRIQNVDINRGILARMLGLSDLHLQTAGASNPNSRGEGRLPGLSREIAEELRDELVRRLRASRSGQGL